MAMNRVAVVGGGAWGTALACAAVAAGREVTLITRRSSVAEAVNASRENPDYLPGLRLPASLWATTEQRRVAASDMILLACPAQHLRTTLQQIAPYLQSGTPLIICAKGIEIGTLALMSDVAAAVAGDGFPLAILSGPSFAAEVVAGCPTAVTLGCHDATLGHMLMSALSSPNFRPYLSDDPVGVQVGGAVKNVIAIACGLTVGLKLGDNARAAVIARGLAEVVRLGVALGAKPETFLGLSGLGDLTLSCSSLQSRNMSLGVQLAEGTSLRGLLNQSRSVVEGVHTVEALVSLADRLGVVLPISTAVGQILNGGASIESCIRSLLARPLQSESTGDTTFGGAGTRNVGVVTA